MSPILVFLLLIGVVLAISIPIGISRGKKMREEMEKGNMIRREGSFWDEETFFYTKATYDEVKNKIKEVDFSNCKVSTEIDFEGCQAVFFCPNPKYWTAVLEYAGESNGKHLFKYYVYSYNQNKLGLLFGDMNICLTSVEKAFLSLDGETTTETHQLQRKTKRSWF